MSFWSAIGLADRDTVNTLLSELQALREENQRLQEENKKLLSRQIQESGGMLATVWYGGFRNTLQVLQDGQDASAEREKRLKEMISQASKWLESRNSARNEAIQDAAGEAMKFLSDMSGGLADRLEQNQTELIKALAAKSLRIEQALSDTQEELGRAMERFEQSSAARGTAVQRAVAEAESRLSQKQDKLFDAAEGIASGQRAAATQISQIWDKTVEEFRQTQADCRDLVRDEEAWLEKFSKLSQDFITLTDAQYPVMAKLSQLSQDSDQFMEIQKSINDMWEIMKAVWVDSLLEEYGKSI